MNWSYDCICIRQPMLCAFGRALQFHSLSCLCWGETEGKREANEELNRYKLVGLLFAVVEYGYVSVLERVKVIHKHMFTTA